MKFSTNLYDASTGQPWHIEIEAGTISEWAEQAATLAPFLVMDKPVPAGSRVAVDIEEINKALDLPDGFSAMLNDFPVTHYTKHLQQGGGYVVALWGEFGDYVQKTIYSETKVPYVKVVGDHGDLFKAGEIHKHKYSMRSEWQDELVPIPGGPLKFYVAPEMLPDGSQKHFQGKPQFRFVKFMDFDYDGASPEPWHDWRTIQQVQAWCEENGVDWDYALGVMQRLSAEKGSTKVVALAEDLYNTFAIGGK